MHLSWLICCNQSYDNPLIVKLLEFDNQRTFYCRRLSMPGRENLSACPLNGQSRANVNYFRYICIDITLWEQIL